jgi:hypothetical protein
VQIGEQLDTAEYLSPVAVRLSKGLRDFARLLADVRRLRLRRWPAGELVPIGQPMRGGPQQAPMMFARLFDPLFEGHYGPTSDQPIIHFFG